MAGYSDNTWGVDNWEVPRKAHRDLYGPKRGIERDCGVRLRLPGRDDPSRTVVVEGYSSGRRDAKERMEQALGWPIHDEALGLIVLNVPKARMGRIIGSRGATIKELEAKHHCNVSTPDRSCEPPDDERVELEGPQERLRALVADIEERVSQHLDVLEEVMPNDGDTTLPVYKGSPIDLCRERRGHFSEALFFEEGEQAVVFQRFLDYLRSATRSIDIAVFNLTHDDICFVLMTAHRNGVVVRLVTDDDQSKSSGSDVPSLRESGIDVRTDVSQAHMHHKFCVLDGECLLTGSFNWTRGAESENEENILVTNDEALVTAYLQHFEKLWLKYLPS